MHKALTKVAAILFVVAIQAQQKIVSTPITSNIGKAYKIASNILNEERSLLIHTPDSYATSSKKYSVIYVLDGDNHFNHAINAVSYTHLTLPTSDLV